VWQLNSTTSRFKALVREGKPGRFAAGGLTLRISSEGAAFWVVRYIVNSKRREITLGRYGVGFGELSLAEAGGKAAQIKADVKSGLDPLAERRRPDSTKFAPLMSLLKTG